MAARPWTQPRTLADFGGLDGLRPAERKLLDERDTGLPVRLGDGSLPPRDPPADRWVRASVLRWLLLGADGAEGRTHEKGVMVDGAFIESDGPAGADTRGLDLEGCTVAHDIGLFACRFEDPPLLRSARLAGLFLNDSHLPGLMADELVTSGKLFLRRVESAGEVCLVGARVGGSLDGCGAWMRNPAGKSFNADGLTATSGLLLRDVESDGEIRLLHANVSGNIECNGAKLRNAGRTSLYADRLAVTGSLFLRGDFESDGEISLLGARIGGNLDCGGAMLRNPGRVALSADRARIDGALMLRSDAAVSGRIELTAAEIGSMADAPACWPDIVALDRCTYKAFTGRQWRVAERIAWLDRQDPLDSFRPQPWEQCARVLREGGHAEDARAVLIAKEVRQRRARRAEASGGRAWALWLWDGVLGATVRYGYQPMRAFACLLGFWLLGTGVFWVASALDALKPNSELVLRSPEWVLCGVAAPRRVFLPSLQRLGTGRAMPGESQRACFERQPEARQYPRFNALVYSADTLLPVVALEMQAFWIPDDTAAPPWGRLARVYLWVQIVVGWFLSLLAVAGFSGIVKSD